MTTVTVFVLLFGWGVQPWAWGVLAFCLFLGAGLGVAAYFIGKTASAKSRQ